MTKKFKTVYQVCPDQNSGWDTLHNTLASAIKEAQTDLDDNGYNKVLHICEIREVKQVKRSKK